MKKMKERLDSNYNKKKKKKKNLEEEKRKIDATKLQTKA